MQKVWFVWGCVNVQLNSDANSGAPTDLGPCLVEVNLCEVRMHLFPFTLQLHLNYVDGSYSCLFFVFWKENLLWSSQIKNPKKLEIIVTNVFVSLSFRGLIGVVSWGQDLGLIQDSLLGLFLLAGQGTSGNVTEGRTWQWIQEFCFRHNVVSYVFTFLSLPYWQNLVMLLFFTDHQLHYSFL